MKFKLEHEKWHRRNQLYNARRQTFAKEEFLKYQAFVSRRNHPQLERICSNQSSGTRILSTLLRYMPKLGPFKALAFNHPTPQTEDLYIKSINTTVDQYRAPLDEVRTDTLAVLKCDLDSGQVTMGAEYSLADDDAYAQLLNQLSEQKFDLTSPELRDNILQFHSDLSVTDHSANPLTIWHAIQIELPKQSNVNRPRLCHSGQALHRHRSCFSYYRIAVMGNMQTDMTQPRLADK